MVELKNVNGARLMCDNLSGDDDDDDGGGSIMKKTQANAPYTTPNTLTHSIQP